MRTILNTVGTSLLSNARKMLDVREPDRHQLVRYLKATDPADASAETNALGHLLREGDKLVFLHSQTEDGELCAAMLALFYGARKHDVELIEIEHLTYTESRLKMRGLRALVGNLSDLVDREQKRGHEVLINATGGFKAEIAYATLVGLLLEVPVYYIHELFKEIVDLPSAPIGWDLSFIEQNASFFRWIGEDMRATTEVEKRLRGVGPKGRILLIEEDGYTMLSPAGEAFFRAWDRKRMMDDVKKVRLTGSDETLTTLQGHSTLWGHVRNVSDVKNDAVRTILRRILAFDFVASVSLGEYHDYSESFHPTRLEKPRMADDELKVTYTLYCSDGSEEVVVNVKRGAARSLIEMLGRVVHA